MKAKNLPLKFQPKVNLRLWAILAFATCSLTTLAPCSAQTNSQVTGFSRLPELPDINSIEPVLSAQNSPRFVPLPALEDLPLAPSELVKLAGALESPESQGAQTQGKIIGSDHTPSLTKTGGLAYLNKPLAPFEIVRKTDAKYSKQVSMDLRNIASQPDPRYLRYWPGNNATWASPAFCYKTLYFEQPNLERYGIGYSCPTNAIVSGGKFFADAALLPFHALRQGPHQCECTLGHRRPGDCNPIQR